MRDDATAPGLIPAARFRVATADARSLPELHPGQAWTYWNKGPGPGEEEWLTTSERDWTISTGRAAAQNLAAAAKALAAAPIPAPPG